MVLIPLSRSDLCAVMEGSRSLPPRAYLDPAVLAWERRALFSSFAAASVADLTRPGQWVRAPLADDRLVVVADASLELALLRDVCLHRAMPLLDGDAGELPALSMTCPYHRWRYGLDGALTAPCVGDASLRAGAVTVDGVTLRAHEPTGAQGIWSRVGWLAGLRAGALRRARRVQWDAAANWKLLVENFQESHHFTSVHPWLEALTPWRRSHSVTDGEGWLGGVMDLRDDAQTVSVTGRDHGRPRIADASCGHRVHDAWLAPNLLTSLQPDYLLTYRLHPLRADLTRIVAEVWVHASARDEGLDEVYALWDRVNAEDRGVCEAQQRALPAATGAGRWHESEDGVRAFDQWVAAAMLRAMEAAG
jgi:Rieske 2Fe-2S family protein